MSADESGMVDTIERECMRQGWDGEGLGGSRGALVYEQWLEVVEAWGVRSPAALGCLLALVREAWSDPNLNTSPDGVTWAVFSAKVDGKVYEEYTEAEALVAALEAAP